MCIMAYIPEGVALPDEETLRRCWKRNSNWGGFMYVQDGRIMIEKFSLCDDMVVALQAKHAAYGATSPFVFHMRLATNGAISMENTHPFRVGNKYAFAHNGVISKFSKDKNVSDSKLFGEQILQKLLYKDWILNDTVKQMMEKYIDSYNKVIILSADKQVLILNKNKGTEEDGIWWSNSGYEDYKTYSSGSNFSGSKSVGKCACCDSDVWVETPVIISFPTYNSMLSISPVCYMCRQRIYKDMGGEMKYPQKCSSCNCHVNYNKMNRDVFNYATQDFEKYCGECYTELLENSTEYYRVVTEENFHSLLDTIEQAGTLIVDPILLN